MNKIYPVFLAFFTMSVSCGSKKFVKSPLENRITFDLKADDELLRRNIIDFFTRYNDDIGNEFLVIDSENPNASIEFIEGLEKNTESGAVGTGRWEIHKILESNDSIINKTLHQIELRFDADHFRTRIENKDFEHLYRLFCHEVGHGIKFNHDAEESSVMYFQIPDDNSNVNYSGYFDRALQFFDPKEDVIIVGDSL